MLVLKVICIYKYKKEINKLINSYNFFKNYLNKQENFIWILL